MAVVTTSTLVVQRAVQDTPQILALELSHPHDEELPRWTPGAHIDLLLPSGRIRQYSLCGDPADRRSYRIAVLREEGGRGGSLEIHRTLREGSTCPINGPRNHFELVDAERYVFLAGGIGITPIMSMLRAVDERRLPWKLVYGARSRSAMAFRSTLGQYGSDRIHFMPQDESGLPDLATIVAEADASTAIYACGPGAMLSALEDCVRQAGRSAMLHVERFSAAPAQQPQVERAFDVELARTGRRLHVPAERRLGDVLRDAGVSIAFSCEEGYCGTCETRVFSGVPDHRDSVLSDTERAEGRLMMVCVGRAKSECLVLDL